MMIMILDLEDMKIHALCVLTMGERSMQTIPINQKINTKRATKEPLVAANYVLSHFLLNNNFLQQQGCDCDTTFYQVSTSVILLGEREWKL